MTTNYSAWAVKKLREGAELTTIQAERLTAPWSEFLGLCRVSNGHDRRTLFDDWAQAHPQGRDIVGQVYAISANAAEPSAELEADIRADEIFVDVPPLPTAARLTAEQARLAGETGEFISQVADHIHGVVNTIPREMNEAAALALVSIGIARRLVLRAPFGDVHPNLWVLWVATSTVWHKTTALNVIRAIAGDAFKHLILPHESSNDRLLQNMAGMKPINFEQLKMWEKKIQEDGWLHAGQRSIIIDEASRLFGSLGKEYNAGKTETFLQAYDCNEELSVETNKYGLIFIRWLYMSIIGATTPSSIYFANNDAMWNSGFWPRFTMLTPARLFPEPLIKHDTRTPRPTSIDAALRRLMEKLPKPVISVTEPAPPPTLECRVDKEAWDAWNQYSNVLTYEMQHPEFVPDGRLRLIYGRLPNKTLRIAMLLAALDWAQSSDGNTVRICLPHYARAQQMAEEWRTNAHRFVEVMNRRPDDDNLERRVIKAIEKLQTGEKSPTTRELQRITHWPRKILEDTLHQMKGDGLIDAVVSGKTHAWRIVK